MQSQIFVRFFSTIIALTPTDTGKLSYFEESSQVIVKDSQIFVLTSFGSAFSICKGVLIAFPLQKEGITS